MAIDLAKAIAGDGEGSTHLVTIEISGCADRAAALAIAKTVANSPLVMTAIHGADPNWGRIVSAAGYANVPFDPQGVSLQLNGFLLYRYLPWNPSSPYRVIPPPPGGAIGARPLRKASKAQTSVPIFATILTALRSIGLE